MKAIINCNGVEIINFETKIDLSFDKLDEMLTHFISMKCIVLGISIYDSEVIRLSNERAYIICAIPEKNHVYSKYTFCFEY